MKLIFKRNKRGFTPTDDIIIYSFWSSELSLRAFCCISCCSSNSLRRFTSLSIYSSRARYILECKWDLDSSFVNPLILLLHSPKQTSHCHSRYKQSLFPTHFQITGWLKNEWIKPSHRVWIMIGHLIVVGFLILLS